MELCHRQWSQCWQHLVQEEWHTPDHIQLWGDSTHIDYIISVWLHHSHPWIWIVLTHIWAWKLRDPATCIASQFQSAFKIKTIIAAVAAACTAGTNAYTANHVESAWLKLNGPFAGCDHRSLESLSEPPVIIWNMVMEWIGDESMWMKPACFKAYSVLQKGGMAVEAKGTKMSTLMPGAWQSVLSGWQSLRQSKRNSPQNSLMVMVFSVSPKLCTQWHWWACAHWRRQDEGMKHYAKLLNIEFEYPSNELPEIPPTAGPFPASVSVNLIRKALSKMKCSKAADPSAGGEGVELVGNMTEAVFN